MPRVHRVERARKPIPSAGIEVGDSYFWWKFRYGGRRVSKKRPKPSQLTQSKLAEVYEAQEVSEEEIAGFDDLEEIARSVQSVGEVARQVSEEYAEAAEIFGGQGENAERAELLEGWADELDEFECEEFFPEDCDEDADVDEERAAHIVEQREAALEKLRECPI